MVRFINQADYAPGSLQPLGPGLGDVLASVFSARRAAEAQRREEARQATLDKAKIEEAEFKRAQSEIDRQLQLRGARIKERTEFAGITPMAQAPGVSAASQGIPEIGPEEAGPAASELVVPERKFTEQAVVDPRTGQEIMPATTFPLKYQEDIARERRAEAKAKGEVVDVTEDVRKALPASIQAAFPVGSALPRSTLEKVESQRQETESQRLGEEARDKRAAEAEAARDRRAAQFADAQARRAEASAAGQATKQTAQQEGRLRIEYNQEAKKTNENLRDLNRGLSVGLPQVPTSLSDHALIYAFNKALDPSSIVKDTEFKSAKTASAGIDQRAFGMLEDLRSGKMTPERRAEMAQVIRNAQSAEQKNLEDIQGHYRDLAGVYEASPERVFGTRLAAAPGGTTSGPTRRKFNPATGQLE